MAKALNLFAFSFLLFYPFLKLGTQISGRQRLFELNLKRQQSLKTWHVYHNARKQQARLGQKSTLKEHLNRTTLRALNPRSFGEDGLQQIPPNTLLETDAFLVNKEIMAFFKSSELSSEAWKQRKNTMVDNDLEFFIDLQIKVDQVCLISKGNSDEKEIPISFTGRGIGGAFSSFVNDVYPMSRITHTNDRVPQFPLVDDKGEKYYHHNTEYWIAHDCNCLETNTTTEYVVYKCPGYELEWGDIREHPDCNSKQGGSEEDAIRAHYGPYFGTNMRDCKSMWQRWW
ncbi:hypothetical protein G9A89_003346 [Geosiphon pyriformis]|nr:hypothetical protein G9A89_003346 [Geosiphon pyriformis]